MNKRHWILTILTLLLATAMTLIPLCSALGFGDFDSASDYGGGSDSYSDYSSYDSGSDSHSRENSNSGKSSYYTGNAGKWIIGVLGFIIIFVLMPVNSIVFNIRRSVKEARKKTQQENENRQNKQEILRNDPDFSEEKVIEQVKKLFVEMQEAWEAGDIHSVQYGFNAVAWNRFNMQLQMKNARGEVTHVRDISFVTVEIIRYVKKYGKQILIVRILVDYNVWVTNAEGKCIQGTESTRHRMDYIWTLERPEDAKTEENNPSDRSHCPHCGAEVDLTAFAECPFCKAQIERKWSGWLLADIRALSQRTLQK